MTAFPALVLAVALTYAFGDVYRPVLPKVVAYTLDLVVCLLVFRVANSYLKKLKG